MFVLGFISILYDYYIYVVLVCANTGIVMSKGKMPAVKGTDQPSAEPSWHKPISKVQNLFLFAAAGQALWFPYTEWASGEPGDHETTSLPCWQNVLLSNILKESRRTAGSILILKLTDVILVITAIFKD